MENLAPPKSDEKFVFYWDMFLDEIKDRELLRKSHLHQLKILCDLCVEYDYLKDLIEIEGRTYISVGRNGEQQKTTESVKQLKDCISGITSYCKMLNLTIGKDSGKVEESNEFKL